MGKRKTQHAFTFPEYRDGGGARGERQCVPQWDDCFWALRSDALLRHGIDQAFDSLNWHVGDTGIMYRFAATLGPGRSLLYRAIEAGAEAVGTYQGRHPEFYPLPGQYLSFTRTWLSVAYRTALALPPALGRRVPLEP